MLKDILKLDGIIQLDRNQLNSIKGLGVASISQACHTVTCTFSDGLDWMISTNDSSVANSFEDRCEQQGGTADQQINCA
ncbi:hypothetical protein GWK08_17570 [Leptobacterium flavescens]|uniref:Uncharacterized protein n=1 Tax=Leptobacterium flavescens TaxID=472055 RepID=A0A6P0URX4_9FLAO|nr:hypothetical protein [Leptobacterium flavescens]NER15270.1 hypothetical protein [Leptobacterium flavescens]